MHYDTLTKEEEYEELVKETNRKSVYQKLPPVERKYMSVPEMGKLLGLKKTARYWLVKKGYFKVEAIMDTLYVDLASFEEWYANQSWYKKVTGEEPGVALKEESYSVEDIHKMLGLNRSHIRCLMKDAGIEYITVSHRRRYLKSQFDQ